MPDFNPVSMAAKGKEIIETPCYNATTAQQSRGSYVILVRLKPRCSLSPYHRHVNDMQSGQTQLTTRNQGQGSGHSGNPSNLLTTHPEPHSTSDDVILDDVACAQQDAALLFMQAGPLGSARCESLGRTTPRLMLKSVDKVGCIPSIVVSTTPVCRRYSRTSETQKYPRA